MLDHKENDMSTKNKSMFEIATRTKLRIASSRGWLSAEQLWDVLLRSNDDFNLDAIARGTNKALKEMSEESFVATSKSPEQEQLELALAVVKHVIAVKIDEDRKNRVLAENRREREKLLEILAVKEADELSDMPREEIEARIRALDA